MRLSCSAVWFHVMCVTSVWTVCDQRAGLRSGVDIWWSLFQSRAATDGADRTACHTSEPLKPHQQDMGALFHKTCYTWNVMKVMNGRWMWTVWRADETWMILQTGGIDLIIHLSGYSNSMPLSFICLTVGVCDLSYCSSVSWRWLSVIWWMVKWSGWLITVETTERQFLPSKPNGTDPSPWATFFQTLLSVSLELTSQMCI